MVYPDEIQPWSRQTSAGFQMIEVDGDHRFLHRNRALLRSTLCQFGGADQVPAPPVPVVEEVETAAA